MYNSQTKLKTPVVLQKTTPHRKNFSAENFLRKMNNFQLYWKLFSWFDRKNRIPFATHFSSTTFHQQQSPFYPSCCSSPYRNGASHKKPYHPILITKRSQAHLHQVYSSLQEISDHILKAVKTCAALTKVLQREVL